MHLQRFPCLDSVMQIRKKQRDSAGQWRFLPLQVAMWHFEPGTIAASNSVHFTNTGVLRQVEEWE